MSRGVLYIATGPDHAREACLSAESVKTAMPDVPVALATDQDVESPSVDEYLDVPDPAYGFADKVYNLERTPFDRTVFLDTDTYVAHDISELFDVLDGFDVAANQFPSWSPGDEWTDDIPECYPEYSTGVLAYERSDRVWRFFEEWKTAFEDIAAQGETEDQYSFRRASYEGDVRIATVPANYNCIYWTLGTLAGPAKVFHGRYFDMDGPGISEQQDLETALEKVNASDRYRVFIQQDEYLRVHTWRGEGLVERLLISLRSHGLRYTVDRAVPALKRAVSDRTPIPVGSSGTTRTD
ncbi:hypothetical protein [Halomarina oriensis]|uniref:Nucleotide-diphospho-sugar transferase domain-containing protein n=1 Tax=Halomarina oriensis TaxID=671145 RepID=A0A6B0GHW7_9EURY|nr:hypothetical protein [Halomarina oriensis]MWG33019.1 hypothetical protein [Halomarina oriensis]